MKKVFTAISIIMMLALLCSCGENNGANSTFSAVEDEKTGSISSSANTPQENEKSEHYEYTHVALEGCVIVKSDRLTGECVYKTKCPICGKTSSGTTSIYLKSGTLNSGAACSNAQCSNWGKHFFDVKIETTSQLVKD